jgi:hypothetical protein
MVYSASGEALTRRRAGPRPRRPLRGRIRAANEAIVFSAETAVPPGRTAEVVPDGRQNCPGRVWAAC